MTYYYHDRNDDYKRKTYDGDPVFAVHEYAEGETRLTYASADSAKQHLFAVLENPPMNLSMVTYGIETPSGEQLFIE